MEGRQSRPLSRDERADLARNYQQPKKPTWDDRSAPASSRLTSAVVSTARDPIETCGAGREEPTGTVGPSRVRTAGETAQPNTTWPFSHPSLRGKTQVTRDRLPARLRKTAAA
jgi:hypothetical protein